MLDNRLQQTNTYTYCSIRKCQLQSTGTGTCNKRLAETRVAVTCIGERYMYNTWQKWNVDPTSLSDPSHSYICELDEAWGTPADDVKVLELSIPVAPKHSVLQTVDWKAQTKNNSSFVHLQPTKSKTASKLVEDKNWQFLNYKYTHSSAIFTCINLPGILKRWGALSDRFFHEQLKEPVQPAWVSTLRHDGKESPPILHRLAGDVL